MATRRELYASFIEFIRNDAQRERKAVNRRMLSVFFWCFLLPAIVSVTILVLVKADILPRRFRSYQDWMLLVFPITYSLYFLSAEVLREIPAAFRRGGTANTLRQAEKDGEWRERVTEELTKTISASPQQWKWIGENFRMDLEAMQNRARHLTVLAGAVFFLLMQGIDSITDPKTVTLVKDAAQNWVDVSPDDFSQFVGLALFLVLLYLSSTQNYHNLRRYLNCVRLLDSRPPN